MNTGTSCYGSSPQREFERSTLAHNTVCVDRENSSQVWSSFRVARRAKVINFESLFKKQEIVTASHDGYQQLKGGPLHRRTWTISDNDIFVDDFLDNSVRPAFARLILDPALSISEVQNGYFRIFMPKKLQLFISMPRAHIEDGYYAPEFGKKERPKSLLPCTREDYLPGLL